jgi:hypothetical protein
MFVSLAAVTLAVQLGGPVPAPSPGEAFVLQAQYRVYAHPPPCGNGFDLSARDGLCYPNGYLAPQDQAARQYPGAVYRGGRYPVACGNGADLDVRDGLCYPNGQVPTQFQQGRIYRGPQYDQDDYSERRPRRRYY